MRAFYHLVVFTEKKNEFESKSELMFDLSFSGVVPMKPQRPTYEVELYTWVDGYGYIAEGITSGEVICLKSEIKEKESEQKCSPSKLGL